VRPESQTESIDEPQFHPRHRAGRGAHPHSRCFQDRPPTFGKLPETEKWAKVIKFAGVKPE